MGAKIGYMVDDNTPCYTTLGDVKHSSYLRGISQNVLYLCIILFPVVPDFGQTSGFRFLWDQTQQSYLFPSVHFCKK